MIHTFGRLWFRTIQAGFVATLLAVAVSLLGAPHEVAAQGFTPPTISAITPTSGPTTGGTPVTITGTNFLAGASVYFGGVQAASVNVVSGTQIVATTAAASAGSASVLIVNPGGGATTLAGGYFYTTPTSGLSITGVDPASGPASGNTQVSITGTGFVAGATVMFGSLPGTNIIVFADGLIVARTPSGGSGTVAVTITNPNGTTAVLPNGFTYPGTSSFEITAVTPATGSTVGGTAVTIFGNGFVSGAIVTFGSLAATNVTVVNSAQISATAPSGAVGAVTVTVINPGGLAASRASGFTYIATTTGGASSTGPIGTVTVASVTPSSGAAAGGTIVTISGTGFLTGASVLFGLVPATNVTVTSTSQITATVPANSVATGAVPVTVVNTGGVSGTLSGAFTYGVITGQLNVSSIAPSSGSVNGGTVVTITGSGLSGVTSVSFGGVAGTGLSATGDSSLRVTAPAHAAGPVPVTVVTSSGSSTTTPNAFVYSTVAAITLTSISPAAGSTAGGTAITLTGSGFATGMTVSIGGTAATNVSVTSASQATATAPARGTTGSADVRVTAPSGETATLTGGFTYQTATATPVTLPATGIGLFVFGGGSNDQLVTATGCLKTTAAFWTTSASGEFISYVPGTTIGPVNAAWNALFPAGIPAGTPLLGKCA